MPGHSISTTSACSTRVYTRTSGTARDCQVPGTERPEVTCDMQMIIIMIIISIIMIVAIVGSDRALCTLCNLPSEVPCH